MQYTQIDELKELDNINGSEYKSEDEKILSKYNYFNVSTKQIENKEGVITGESKSIKFNHLKIVERLQELGYTTYFLNDVLHLLSIKNNVAETTEEKKINIHVSKIFNSMPDTLPNGVKKRMVLDKFLDQQERYFKKSIYNHLHPLKEIEFYKDDRSSACFFYENCIVRVTANNIETLPYTDQQKTVWKSQILKREFKKVENYECNWMQFCKNIAGQEHEQRFNSIKSITGYLLHKYFDDKRKAIYLTDGRVSDDADGRSGKTLWCRGFGYMLNSNFKQDKSFVEIGGKNFDVTQATRYQDCSLETTLIHINDIESRGKYAFKVDSMFNDISDGVNIRQMYKAPFPIDAKFIISGNRSIEINGGSAKDRILEMELADHYSVDYSPSDEFKEWFFRDWDKEEFNKFDNYHIHCVQYYLKNGLIKPDELKLKSIKLRNETCEEFLFFMDDLKILNNLSKRYHKRQLQTEFVNRFPEVEKWLKPRTFTRFLRKFCDYTPQILSYSEFAGGDEMRKRHFEPRNQAADIDIINPNGKTLPSGDCFIFHSNPNYIEDETI